MAIGTLLHANIPNRIVRQDWRIETGSNVRAFATRPANDNLSFADRVKAEIAEAARAVGQPYTERELQNIAAHANALARSARARLDEKRAR